MNGAILGRENRVGEGQFTGILGERTEVKISSCTAAGFGIR